MSGDTFFRTAEFYTVKGAQRDLIRLAGGIDRAALVTGLSTSRIGSFNNRETPDIMPIHIVAKLEADVRQPVVSRALVLLAGGEVVVPTTNDRGESSLVAASAEMMSSSAEVMTENAELYGDYAKAAADGDFSPAELWQMRPKAEDALRAADHARGAAVHFLSAIDRQLAGAVRIAAGA